MADLLIPLLVVLGIIGLLLVGALVHQLRDLEPRSERPAPNWQRGGEASTPVLPWQRRGEEEAPDRPAPAPQPAAPPRRPERQATPERAAPLWKRARRDSPDEPPPAPGRTRGRCSTCGGTGTAIVQSAGGRLEHGPCPDCQG